MSYTSVCIHIFFTLYLVAADKYIDSYFWLFVLVYLDIKINNHEGALQAMTDFLKEGDE